MLPPDDPDCSASLKEPNCTMNQLQHGPNRPPSWQQK